MKINELISISPGFHRSVNIRMDLSDAAKIANYIPTVKSEAIIGHVAEALQGANNDGATMLIGSYGTGKSHLATFLASVAGKTVPLEAYRSVIEKLRGADTRTKLEAALHDKPYLVVPVSGTTDLNLDQQLLVALKQALDTRYVNIELKSSFTAALSTLERWKKYYPETYASLDSCLQATDYPDIVELEKDLAHFDCRALQLFVEQYPKLTAGASFDLLSGEVAEVYRNTCFALVEQGYQGIMLIFDEFNKVMDVSVQDGQTLKTLQDLAEMACRADQGFILNLVLISHRTISQYVSRIEDTFLPDEWRKIEGRFRIFDVSNQPWETYDIISRVLKKNQGDYFQRLVEQNPVIGHVSRHRRLKALLDTGVYGQQGEQHFLEELMTKACLPLHPITVFLLPRISSRVAQNERTLFTFLAGQDGSVLKGVLDREVCDFLYVSPWHLYDYFEEPFSRSQESEIKDVWVKVTNALEALNEGETIEAAIIKTVGMLQLGGNAANLPCTLDIVEFALAGHPFQEAIDTLVKRKLVFVKQSTGEMDIVEPVELDVEQTISNWLLEHAIREPFPLLEEFGFAHYIVTQRYNHKHKIIRYLTPVYAGSDDAISLLPDGLLAPQFDGLDGVVLYLFPDNYQELARLVELATSASDQRALFVLPTAPVETKSTIRRVAALTAIHQELMGAKMEQRALHFVELHLLDAKQELSMKLDKLTRPSPRVRYFWAGEELKDIVDEKSLSTRCSEIMAEIYKESPLINNELINRATPTSTSKRARNDVIDAILDERVNLRASLRSAQERFMFDTIYGITGLYDEKASRVNFVCGESTSTLNVIDSFFKEAKEEQRSFEPLVRLLSAPPYGIRKGVLPALLAIYAVKYKHYVTIVDTAGRDCQIDAALLDRIVDMPEKYSLKLEDWNEALEQFTVALAKLFGWQRCAEAFFSNQFADLGYEVFRWFSGLPRYSRETGSVSNQAIMLRRIARIASQRPRQALLRDLPKALGFRTVTQDNVDLLLEALTSCKAELDGALARLRVQMASELHGYLLRFGNSQESLISLARNMATVLSVGGVNQEWASIVAFVNGFEGYNELEFTNGFLHHLTGVRLEDWLDTTRADLLRTLDSITKTTKQVATASDLSPRVEIVFHEEDGHGKFVMQQCEVSDLGEMLQAHLLASINNFGNAISSLEKQQILLNILREIQ